VIARSNALDSSYFGARWRHSYREIAVRNSEKFKNWRKSLCAPLHIDSLEISKKVHCSTLEQRT